MSRQNEMCQDRDHNYSALAWALNIEYFTLLIWDHRYLDGNTMLHQRHRHKHSDKFDLCLFWNFMTVCPHNEFFKRIMIVNPREKKKQFKRFSTAARDLSSSPTLQTDRNFLSKFRFRLPPAMGQTTIESSNVFFFVSLCRNRLFINQWRTLSL